VLTRDTVLERLKKSPMNQVGDQSARRSFGLPLLVAGVVCLGFYILMSTQLSFFQMARPFYTWGYCGRIPWGPLAGSSMRYFDPEQVSSILWKLAALLPAIVCLSIWVVSRYGARLDNLIERATAGLSGCRGLIFFSALSLLVIVLLVIFSFEARPIVDDEIAYLFQAKTYLTGHLYLPSPPAADSIKRTFMIVAPVWTTKYLWGHPFILAVGLFVGSPYVATIGMSVASLALLYLVGLRTATRKEASLAVAFMGLSPWFWFTSATLLSHVSMLFLLLLFLWGWFYLEANPKALPAIGLGFCLAWAITIRPLTTIAWCLPFGFLLAKHMIKEPRKWAGASLGFLIGGGVIFGAILYYNHLVTGNALTLPFSYYSPDEKMGFGFVTPTGELRPFYDHTPMKGIVNAAIVIVKMNSWFLGWPISLLPFLGLVIARSLGQSTTQQSASYDAGIAWKSTDTLWVSIILCVFAAHLVYYSPGISETGPFYYYELLVPLCFLAAKGLLTLYETAVRWGYMQVARFISVFVVLSTVGSLWFFVPEKAMHINSTYSQALLPYQMSEKSIDGKALVFVGYRRPPGWLLCLPYPSLDLNDRILFVHTRGKKIDTGSMRTFPDRTPYLLCFRVRTGKYDLVKLEGDDPSGEMERLLKQEALDRQ
jgi:hypothetical protein